MISAGCGQRQGTGCREHDNETCNSRINLTNISYSRQSPLCNYLAFSQSDYIVQVGSLNCGCWSDGSNGHISQGSIYLNWSYYTQETKPRPSSIEHFYVFLYEGTKGSQPFRQRAGNVEVSTVETTQTNRRQGNRRHILFKMRARMLVFFITFCECLAWRPQESCWSRLVLETLIL